MWKKIFNARFWKYALAVAVPLCVVVLLVQQVDNDTWYVLAEGREIAQNGLYYEDRLSMHERLDIVVQNYGFAALSWWIYSLMGMVGIYGLMIILFLILLFLIYKICMLISNKNENLSLLIMSVVGTLMAVSGFVVTREQMLGYVVMMAVIYVLELYIKNRNSKYLVWIPVLSLILINMRAATWLMIFLIMLTYVIDGIKKPKLHLEGYKIWPIVVAGAVAILVGLANPYGLKMMTFIFRSYGDTDFMRIVSELNSFSPAVGTNLFCYLGIIGVITAYAFGNKKNVRVRYLLMFFGFLFLGLTSVKGMAELMLVMMFPLALLYKDWKMPILVEHAGARRAFIMWSGTIASAVAVAGVVSAMILIKNEPRETLAELVDTIDTDVGEGAKAEVKVYAGYNDGGYLEWRGYKPYLDPRGEVFLIKNNGKEDILHEWIDLKEGKMAKEDFMEKYDFDYVVTTEDDVLYDYEGSEYEMIYDVNGDRLYKKISSVENEANN